jgi:hypothetical protein
MWRITRQALPILGILALVLAATPSRAAAQTPVTAADIQRMQDSTTDLDGDITRLRSQDAQVADQLERELDQIREEMTYLKVKLRKEGSVARGEFTALSDRVDALRKRLADTRTPAPAGRIGEVPVGTELDVRLQTPLDSATAQVEDRFEATTVVELQRGDTVLIPAGSVMRGFVSSVSKATRVERKGSLTLRFSQITINGATYPVRATVMQALESEGLKGEAGRIGAGAGVGAIIGGILGGFRGALAGILIGGGGTVAATTGTDVKLAPGTILRVRIDAPVSLK